MEKQTKLLNPSMWDKVAEVKQYSIFVSIYFYNGNVIDSTKKQIAETIGLDVRKDHIMDIIDGVNVFGEHIQQEIEVPIEEWEFNDKQIQDYLTRKNILMRNLNLSNKTEFYKDLDAYYALDKENNLTIVVSDSIKDIDVYNYNCFGMSNLPKTKKDKLKTTKDQFYEAYDNAIKSHQGYHHNNIKWEIIDRLSEGNIATVKFTSTLIPPGFSAWFKVDFEREGYEKADNAEDNDIRLNEFIELMIDETDTFEIIKD